jgi:hypothetical protein
MPTGRNGTAATTEAMKAVEPEEELEKKKGGGKEEEGILGHDSGGLRSTHGGVPGLLP